jgi:two-component system cell cycle sensor histidine kinase/response regulator CckA
MPPLAKGGPTILVVDDDPAVRALIVQILRRGGYDVLEASDGERALGLAEAHRGPIDLLLTDMVMPGLLGSEVAARLGAVRPDTPTVFVSGQPQGEIVRDGVIGPDVRFVPKPFTADTLLKCVREALAAARV